MYITLIGERRELEPTLVERLRASGYAVSRLADSPNTDLAANGEAALPAVLRDLAQLDSLTLVIEAPTDAAAEERPLVCEDLKIFPGQHQAWVDRRQVPLTHSEFALLVLLARRMGQVLSRAEIIAATKGSDYPVTGRSVDVMVASLRRKLNFGARHLQTVRGAGYRLQPRPARSVSTAPSPSAFSRSFTAIPMHTPTR